MSSHLVYCHPDPVSILSKPSEENKANILTVFLYFQTSSTLQNYFLGVFRSVPFQEWGIDGDPGILDHATKDQGAR